MLDEFLQVAYITQTRKQAEYELVGLLKDLPDMELRKIASGTPIAEMYRHLDKTAYLDACSPDGTPKTFLDKFKGTPLFEQAVALEQQELQAEMTDMQKRQERRQQNATDDSLYDAKDRLRVQKRLLELELAKQESGAPAGGAAPPGDPAQGAGAPGPVPPEDIEAGAGGVVGKTAALKTALLDVALGTGLGGMAGARKAQAAGAPAEEGAMRGALGGGGGALIGGGVGGLGALGLMRRGVPMPAALALPIAGSIAGGVAGYKGLTSKYNKKEAAAEKIAFADKTGRELARSDFAKTAHAEQLRHVGAAAGVVMAKTALALPAGLGGMASKALGWAAKNPGAAGSIAGAGLGAAGGAIAGGPDHRLSGALGGAALGGAAGGMGAGTIGRVQAGQTLGAAAANTARSGINTAMRGANTAASKLPGQLSTPVTGFVQKANQMGHDAITGLGG